MGGGGTDGAGAGRTDLDDVIHPGLWVTSVQAPDATSAKAAATKKMRKAGTVRRRRELLRLAGAALEEGRDPFSDLFLRDNDVTLSENGGLSDDLATGARLLGWALDHPEAARAALDEVRLAVLGRGVPDALL
jgi:acyl-CoA reductase-like NAD-dependent aldehyde dehydrogenase